MKSKVQKSINIVYFNYIRPWKFPDWFPIYFLSPNFTPSYLPSSSATNYWVVLQWRKQIIDKIIFFTIIPHPIALFDHKPMSYVHRNNDNLRSSVPLRQRSMWGYSNHLITSWVSLSKREKWPSKFCIYVILD